MSKGWSIFALIIKIVVLALITIIVHSDYIKKGWVIGAGCGLILNQFCIYTTEQHMGNFKLNTV